MVSVDLRAWLAKWGAVLIFGCFVAQFYSRNGEPDEANHQHDAFPAHDQTIVKQWPAEQHKDGISQHHQWKIKRAGRFRHVQSGENCRQPENGSNIKNIGANNVGDRNAEFVRDYLETEQISVVAEDLLDIYPRKVYYFPATGRVMVKKLKSLHNTTLLDREMEYSLRIKKTPVCGEIDLF